MAGFSRSSRPASGLKRKLSVTNDTLFADGDDRMAKRISPFHNTPIQKKETKRRILKISMRKMREIDCPETYLRRSVLINNLARSLQDDLKDDKIWARWDWAGDVDTLPCRSPSPNPVTARDAQLLDARTVSSTCTLLTNACTSVPSSGSVNQWTFGTQSHWLSADEDAHMSQSERERVSRDLTQSHDRLAATVESLTSFDNDFSTTDKCLDIKGSCISLESCNSFHSHPDKNITHANVLCCNSNQVQPVCGNHMGYTDSLDNTVPNQDFCLAKRDINKNQVYPCTGCHTKASETLSPADIHHSEHYTPTSYISSIDTPLSQPLHHLTSKVHCEDSRYSDIHLEKLQCFDRLVSKESWPLSCPNVDYPDDIGATYLDMTSNSVCRVTTESSTLLDSLDSCIPCLQTSVHSTTVPMDTSTSMADQNHHLPTNALSSDNNPLKCNFTTANSLSPVDVTSSSTMWNSAYPDPGSPQPASSCASPGLAGSCSSEVERPERVTSPQYPDPERFTSQSLRDFDIIYNNLVSVLIGGN